MLSVCISSGDAHSYLTFPSELFLTLSNIEQTAQSPGCIVDSFQLNDVVRGISITPVDTLSGGLCGSLAKIG